MIGDGPGLEQLGDLRSEVLADARDRKPFGRAEIGNALGRVDDGFGGVAVRADLERVFRLDFQQVPDLRENAGDGLIVHRCER